MLETTGHRLEDVDGIVALGIWLESAYVEECRQSQNDDDKGIAHDG